MARSEKVKAGDGHTLPRFRWWQLFSRSLFHLYLARAGGAPGMRPVDVRHGGHSDGEVYAQLYRDGVNQARSKLPAAFAVPVAPSRSWSAASGSAVPLRDARRSERQLIPDPASAEGRRARLERTNPGLSRAVGAASVSVLAVALVLAVPQIIEQITQLPPIAERIGTFTQPRPPSRLGRTSRFCWQRS